MKRKRLTKAKRASILAAQGGCCCVFGCVETENLIEEHSTVFVWTGGEADQLMCAPHHKLKTALDMGRIAKVKRLQKKAAGETKKKRPIPSRGFRKDVSKKMDGSVVRK